jgi:GntR family transcriptional regulator, transcriptional repressor for pyruvate dehydrogenase complex
MSSDVDPLVAPPKESPMSTTPTFAPIRAQRAFDEIMLQIRELIRTGQLQPGDRLPAERELALQFSVSRNTVREALRMLEIAGVLELRRGHVGGAFVAQADSSRIASTMSDMLDFVQIGLSDLTEARLWLELSTTRIAAERMTDEIYDRLANNVREMEELMNAQQWEQKTHVSVEFDIILAEATENPLIVVMARTMMEVVERLALALGPGEHDMVLQSRKRMLKHLRARDADAAVAEMERHLKRLHKMWLTADYPGSHYRPAPADD